MSGTDTREETIRLAMECMALQHGERPEVQWLKEKYQEFMRREGIVGKEEADKCIYRRMYGKDRPPSPREPRAMHLFRQGAGAGRGGSAVPAAGILRRLR